NHPKRRRSPHSKVPPITHAVTTCKGGNRSGQPILRRLLGGFLPGSHLRFRRWDKALIREDRQAHATLECGRRQQGPGFGGPPSSRRCPLSDELVDDRTASHYFFFIVHGCYSGTIL